MEWNDIMTKLQNPDTLAEGLTELHTWKADNDAAMQKLTDGNTANEKRIRELQDSNMRLYLRVTGDDQKEEDKEPETFDELLKKVKEENKNGNN